MSAEREFEGKVLEDALHAAAESLGIAEPELDYKIVEQGRRGLFGLGARSVRIRVMPPLAKLHDGDPEPTTARKRVGRRGAARRSEVRSSEARSSEAREAEAPKRAPAVEPVAEEVTAIQSTVQRMLELMQFELPAQTTVVESGVNVEFNGADSEMLTDKDGELGAAMQFLLNRMARRAWPSVGRVNLAPNGERRRRDEELTELIREVAQQVSQTGKPKRLHEMNAYERRLVHLTIREYQGLGSRSEGNGHLKRVRVFRQQGGGRKPRSGGSDKPRRGGSGRNRRSRGNRKREASPE